MKVIKRDGLPAAVDFNKIDARNRNLARPDLIIDSGKQSKVNQINKNLHPLKEIDPTLVSKEVIQSIYDGVTSVELDIESARIAQALSTHHPQFGTLAARIFMSNFHKNNVYDLARNHYKVRSPSNKMMNDVENSLFKYTADALWNNTDKQGYRAPLIAPHVYNIVMKNHERFELMMDYSKDFNYDFMGMNMIDNTYLLKANMYDGEKMRRVTIERPQHMLMRIAIGIHCSKEYKPYSEVSTENDQFMAFQKWIKDINFEMSSDQIYTLFIALLPHLKLDDSNKRINWNNIDPNQYGDGLVTDEQWHHIEATYYIMSNKMATHATPTLFNAGTLRPQCSSCYLLQLFGDSLEGIAKLFTACMHIQKWAGGIGSSAHNLRAQGTYIRGTNGTSNGLKPYARVLDAISEYIDQGGQKRPGSHAVYLEPWHGDIFAFLELRKHRGDVDDEKNNKARGLFYAVWNPDEFMWRVENDMDWYLMCPDQSPGLALQFNAKYSSTFVPDEQIELNPTDYAFSALYRKYIKEGKYIQKVKAQQIWNAITELQSETGLPYMLYKDNVNRKNNQANLGTITQSNLCCEIVEYTSSEEVAVCNLASICLPAFVKEVPYEDAQKYQYTYNTSLEEGVIILKRFDMNALQEVTKQLTYNLDKVIDINYYPIPETKRSNLRHRPIGLGIQGLADMFAMLRLPFHSQEAVRLSYYIFENIYYSALTQSIELAKQNGTYETYQGSPASQGFLQFDLLEREGTAQRYEIEGGKQVQVLFDHSLDWDSLKTNMAKYGLRNSLLVAPMPTASTSYIMGNSPCFEPFNSNIYNRATKDGEFVIVNDLLINDLVSLGLWNQDMKRKLILANGSVQNILEIPKNIRDIYATAWDIPSKWLMFHEIARSPHIDQSQSANRFVAKPNPSLLSKLQFFVWRRGLKTGSYYIHSRPSVDAQKLQIADEKASQLIYRSTPHSTTQLSESKQSFRDKMMQRNTEPTETQMVIDGSACLECGS